MSSCMSDHPSVRPYVTPCVCSISPNPLYKGKTVHPHPLQWQMNPSFPLRQGQGEKGRLSPEKFILLVMFIMNWGGGVN